MVTLISTLALIGAVALAYMNSMNGPFIFDDEGSVTMNPYIHKLWPLSDVLFRAPPDTAPAGRPIVSLTLAINYAIGGLDVRGYHLFNIAVHLASVLTLWGIIRRTLLRERQNACVGPASSRSSFRVLGCTSRDADITCGTGILSAQMTGWKPVPHQMEFLAFAIALIWAIHPLQTESVTYVSQRTELLMGLFYLLTLYCAIRAWQSDSNRLWSVAAVVACAVGMGSKEAMVSAPLIVLLYDVTLVSTSLRDALRRHAKLYVGLAATWGLLAWLNLHAPRGLTCGAHLGLSRLDYLRTQADIIVWYLRLCFWPHPLVISYQDWPLARSFGAIVPQGLLIISLLALTAWGIRKRHPAAILGAWFFMILAPTSSFVPIVTELAAERRMYLPLIAVVIAAVIGCAELLWRMTESGRFRVAWASVFRLPVAQSNTATGKLRLPMPPRQSGQEPDSLLLAKTRLAMPSRATTAIAVIALAFTASTLCYGTILRNRDYQTALGIWTDAVEKRPNNWAALQNLSSTLLDLGDFQGAIRCSNRTIELKPDFAEPYSSLGVAYGRLGDLDLALTNSSRAIELKPSFTEAYSNRANVYSARREYDLAIADCSKAIELNPDYAEAYSNRAIAYGSSRNYERAIADCNKAIELKLDCVEAYLNRGSTYIAMHDYNQALADFQTALKIKPNQVKGHYNLAVAYYHLKQYDQAWANVEKCKQLGGQVKPQFLDALTKASSQPG